MQERMKELREKLGLNQRQFAERLGVRRNTVSTYEVSGVTPSNAVITAICKEFNVNRAWLEHGEEPMFNPPPEGDLIDEVAREYNLSPKWTELIRALVTLDPATQEAGVRFMQGLVQQYQSEPQPEPMQTKEEAMLEAARIAAEQWDLEHGSGGKNRQSGSVPTAG